MRPAKVGPRVQIPHVPPSAPSAVRSVLPCIKERHLQYWIETLGCPKNHVDSDKLAGLLASQGYQLAGSAEEADLVVANTCAFIEAAREESIETVLELAERKLSSAHLDPRGRPAARRRCAASLPVRLRVRFPSARHGSASARAELRERQTDAREHRSRDVVSLARARR